MKKYTEPIAIPLQIRNDGFVCISPGIAGVAGLLGDDEWAQEVLSNISNN